MWSSRYNIEVWRGGAKGDERGQLPLTHAAIDAGLPVDGVPFHDDGLTIQFTIQGDERGSTFDVWVGSSSFEKLAGVMLRAAPEKAEIAFLSAMLKQRQKNA